MSTTTTNKITIYIDASLLRHAACRRKINFISRGWRSKQESVKPIYGNAIHEGLRFFYKNRDSVTSQSKLIEDSIEKAINFFRPFEKLATEKDKFYDELSLESVLTEYFEHYGEDKCIQPLKADANSALAESKFCIDYLEDEDYIVKLAGTIDLVAGYYKRLCIIDHKTTGSKQQDWFLAKESKSIQFKFYSWCMHKLTGIGYLPVVVNCIFLKQITANSPTAAYFRRSDVIEFDERVMEDFGKYVDFQVKQILREYRDTPMPEYSQCGEGYPVCRFSEICDYPPHLQGGYITSKFDRKEYNPLTRSEIED